jgi:hypothetical protein
MGSTGTGLQRGRQLLATTAATAMVDAAGWAKCRKADIGAREHREVGWFTLCNIPCDRAIFAEYPEGWVSSCHQRHRQLVLINRSKR